MENPKIYHWKVRKRILRYIVVQKIMEFGILIHKMIHLLDIPIVSR
jgi:hypothetical protein